MPAFDYSRNISLNTYLNATGQSFTNSFQIALLVTQAEASDTTLTAKEPTGNNYSRITTSAGMWATPVSGGAGTVGHGCVANVAPLIFPQASGTWGTIIQTAVLNSVSGGTNKPLFYGNVRPEISVGTGSPPVMFGVGCYHIEMKGFGFSNNARDQIMLGYFGGSSFYPSTYYLALLSDLPEPDGTGLTEVASPGSAGYARQVMTNNTTYFTTATTGITYNNQPIVFPQPTGSWGSIVAWALMDASSGGGMWFYGPLEPVIASITANSLPPVIQAGQMAISLDALR